MASRPAPAQRTTVWIWDRYSLAERDRRWSAVRQRAAEAGFDAIWVPIGNQIDARYLTQLRNSSIVIPTDGRPPVVVTDRGSVNEWVPEGRFTVRAWGKPMGEALLEAGLDRARIGVAGLKGGKVTHARAPDGSVNYTAFKEACAMLPNATFEDATDVVGFVRYVKSSEEVECLRIGAEIAEAGIDEMVEVARPGVDAAVLYAAVMERMLIMGSEYVPLAFTVDPIGEPARRIAEPPTGVRLAPNGYISNEVSAMWGAQHAQEDQPILLGKLPDQYRSAVELQHEVFQAGLQKLAPGTSFGEFVEFINGFGKDSGMTTAALIHGRGYGDDGPLISPRAKVESVQDIPILAGTTWVWKPTVTSADGRFEFTWGGDVVVTDQGGQPLFKRPHGLVEIAD
jgi:Xaa-Pro dipeptidase